MSPEDLATDGGCGGDGADPSTMYVEDPPRRLSGNVLIDGADGQCIYVYAGIEERCQNDAVAHTFMEHGGEPTRVEMCAEHAREDVPEPPTLEQQELIPDGGIDVDRPVLEFADQYVAPILDGEKTATVRLDGPSLALHDRVTATDEDGTGFASLEIQGLAFGTVRDVLDLLEVFGAGYGAETPRDVLAGLREHYDEPVTPSTRVDIYVFELTRRAADGGGV